MNNKKVIPVVACVIWQGDKVLLGKRPTHKDQGGLWEFPGGKLEEGECYLEAATRELEEELGVTVLSLKDPVFSSQEPGTPFQIHFCETEISGEPEAKEHEELGWFKKEELSLLPLAASDRRFVISAYTQ